jgi:GT2 family glycosyltransferase
MSRTAAIVVAHNSAGVIPRCLAACRRAGTAEIVVVDNASSDATPAAVAGCQGVRLLANRDNLGFAAAANQGVRATAAPLLLLLNPDVELLDPLADLEMACSQPGVAAAAGLLVGEDGQPQRGFSVRRLPAPAALAFEVLGLNRLWPSNPVNRRYRCLDLDLARPQDVEQPAGAFLMFRRDAWSALGGFDEAFYPVWFEDVDFCRRLADAGLRLRLVPSVRAVHVGGHSFREKSPRDLIVWWHQSLLKYVSRHFPAGARRRVCGAILLSAVLRMVTGVFTRSGSGGTIRAYGKVMSLALASLRSASARPGPAGPRKRTDVTAESIQ